MPLRPWAVRRRPFKLTIIAVLKILVLTPHGAIYSSRERESEGGESGQELVKKRLGMNCWTAGGAWLYSCWYWCARCRATQSSRERIIRVERGLEYCRKSFKRVKRKLFGQVSF